MADAEKNEYRLDRAEEDIKSLKEDVKGKADAKDVEKLDTAIGNLVTKVQMEDVKKDIVEKIDDTENAIGKDIDAMEKNISDKVSRQEFQPFRIIIGTVLTIFAGVILTQLARWALGAG